MEAALWTPRVAMLRGHPLGIAALAFGWGVAMGTVGMGLTLLFARCPLDVVSGAIMTAIVIGC